MATPRKVKTAQALIEAERFDDARMLLNSVQHPTAEELNLTLNGRTQRPMIVRASSFTMPQHKTTLRWMDRFFPHAEVDPDDPLFHYEIRNLAYGRTHADLKAAMLRWMGYVMFPLMGIWLAVALWALSMDDLGIVVQVLTMAFGISFLDKFVLDFTAVTAGLDSVRRDMAEGRWDLICLTDISAKRIAVAKYCAAQIRAWRIMTFIIAFRLAVALAALLTFFVLPFVRDPALLREVFSGSNSLEDWAALVGSFIGLIVFIGIYVIEPRWRLRTLAAGSIMVSSRVQESTFAVLSAFWIVFRVWLLQIFMAFGSIMVFWVGAGILFAVLLIAGISPLLFGVGIGMFIRSVYRNQSLNWLSSGYRRLLLLGGAR